jgi:hemerythrin-like domain-containing protein
MDRVHHTTADLIPELVEWAREAELPDTEPRGQNPIDELVAEHHLIRIALSTMLAEASRFAREKNLRIEFWDQAVDFVGNFGLLRHYRKKANHLFPTLASCGFEMQLEGLDAEQTKDIELALELCDAIGEGDWENVARLVALYAGIKKKKMEREEQQLLYPGKELIPAVTMAELRSAFDQVDRTIPPERTRKEYLDMVKRLVKMTGIPDPFGVSL